MTGIIHPQQARRFLLARQGLLGAKRFKGAQGLLAYVRQVGCVQYDPVDVCGKSHELAFLARVKGFSREMLACELYEKHTLLDYFDKNMCILSVEDWPYLAYTRQSFRNHTRSAEAVDAIASEVLNAVHQRGCLSAQELGIKEKADWYWSSTSLGRAALETLYFRGDLVVHHKSGTVKSYALASDCLPAELLAAPCPLENERALQKWQVKRRIGAVGLLWNAASDAWLGVNGLNAQARNECFDALLAAGEIAPLQVEGIDKPLYLLSPERELLEACAQPLTSEKRVALLAPLDCLMWDRRLIAALFHFSYKWEIYTPESQRRYGYYVLPVLYGEGFAGRVEPVCDRREGILWVQRFWPENGFAVTNRFLWAMEDALDGLRAYHGLSRVCWRDAWMQPAGDLP